ncbi:MAG: RHS repeat-associated core domain-containing protein [candidate division FCPU426 bacterium]
MLPVLAGLAGLTFVAYKVSGILNGLSSGGLTKALARFVFVQGVADTVFGQNVFPATLARESLKQAEFLNRASRDPLGMLLAVLGPDGSRLLPEADSWTELLLEKIKERMDLSPTQLGLINDYLQADRATDIVSLVRFCLKGLGILNSPAGEQNAETTGHPITLHRGEFFSQHTDFTVNGAGMDFAFRRTYRSRTLYYGPLGPQWDHNYNLRLREENEYLVEVLTGELKSTLFARHPDFDSGLSAGAYNYFAPPNGVHDVLVPCATPLGPSYVLEKTGGLKYEFQPTGQLGQHRIRRILNPYGHCLEFYYSDDDRLKRVDVNSPGRHVNFDYDQEGRLVRLSDHTGRFIGYAYDDWGHLSSVAGPAQAGGFAEILEKYEYDCVGQGLKLARIVDWQGRITAENQYETNALSEFFGYVIRQRENQGEMELDYEWLDDQPETEALADQAVLLVRERRRSGHVVSHYLNEYGNELHRREKYAAGCGMHEAVTCNRFNPDGALVARLGPDGAVRQYLYGRDHLADFSAWPEMPFVLAGLTKQDRMSFGNLLAEVARAERLLPAGLGIQTWWRQLPPVKTTSSPRDRVIKSRFEPERQLLLSRSDPRHTRSADPLHAESLDPGAPGFDPNHPHYQAHQRHLSCFEYGSQGQLLERRLPDRTRPSSALGQAVLTNLRETFHYADCDGKLREVRRVDMNGFEWLTEYYAETDAARAGFVRRRFVPQADWKLDGKTPDVLEIRKYGTWQATESGWLSGGAAGDGVAVDVEGTRITLYQTCGMDERRADHPEVEIKVDGQVRTPGWNQAQDAEYIIDGLERGAHRVELRDMLGQALAVGRIRSQATVEEEADPLGRVVRQTDARGRETQYVFNPLGFKIRQARMGAPGPLLSEFAYDPKGRLLLERQEWRDETGILRASQAVRLEREYDSGGNLTVERRGPEAGGPMRTQRKYYNDEDLLCKTRDARGALTYRDYDPLRRLVRTTQAACSPDRSVDRFFYDEAGNVRFTQGPRGFYHYHGFWQGDQFCFSVDAWGRPLVQTDAAGHLSVIDYDQMDNPLILRRVQQRPDGQYELLSRLEKEYDEHGSLIRQAEAVFSEPILSPVPTDPEQVDEVFFAAQAQGRVTRAIVEHHLDALGREWGVVQPGGGCRSRRLDGQGRPVEETDEVGNRLFRVFDGSGNAVRVYTFEPVRNPGTGEVVRHEVFLMLSAYDDFNREIRHVDAFGNCWEHAYDSLGNRVMTRDPLGNITRWEHNAFGQVIKQTQEMTSTGLGGAPLIADCLTQYEYDANGNTTAIVDPAGRRTEFKYDALNREVESWYAIGSAEPRQRLRYDPAGNVVSLTDRSGRVFRRQYDPLNRMVAVTVDESAVLPADRASMLASRKASFAYDAAGHLTTHANEYCQVAIARDSGGLPLWEKVTLQSLAGVPPPQTLTWSYGLNRKKETVIYPSGRRVGYRYDRLGRVTAVTDPTGGGDIATYRYVGERLLSAHYGNGLALNLAYDGRGLSTERSLSDRDQNVLWRNQVLRDPAGFVRRESCLAPSEARTRTYALDSLYRLAHYQDGPLEWFEKIPAISPPGAPVEPDDAAGQQVVDAFLGTYALPADAVFDYDEMGNRLATREPGLPEYTSVPNELNQYQLVAGRPWLYDRNGSLRQDQDYRYTYDSDGSLQEVFRSDTNARQAAYYRDALGRVVAEVSNEAWFRFHGEQLPMAEWQGGRWKEFVAGNGPAIIVQAWDGDEPYWLTHDRLNSLRVLSDRTGGIRCSPTYRPFGAPEGGEWEASPFNAGFAGMWHTPGVPLYHSRTRSYSSSLGRFLQRDPAGVKAGLNLYTYANNNPAAYLDATGLAPTEEIGDAQAGEAVDPALAPVYLSGYDAIMMVLDYLLWANLVDKIYKQNGGMSYDDASCGYGFAGSLEGPPQPVVSSGPDPGTVSESQEGIYLGPSPDVLEYYMRPAPDVLSRYEAEMVLKTWSMINSNVLSAVAVYASRKASATGYGSLETDLIAAAGGQTAGALLTVRAAWLSMHYPIGSAFSVGASGKTGFQHPGFRPSAGQALGQEMLKGALGVQNITRMGDRLLVRENGRVFNLPAGLGRFKGYDVSRSNPDVPSGRGNF